MAAPLPDPLTVTREPAAPWAQPGVEPPAPAMKTPVPGPKSMRLKQELNEIQVWVSFYI